MELEDGASELSLKDSKVDCAPGLSPSPAEDKEGEKTWRQCSTEKGDATTTRGMEGV